MHQMEQKLRAVPAEHPVFDATVDVAADRRYALLMLCVLRSLFLTLRGCIRSGAALPHSDQAPRNGSRRRCDAVRPLAHDRTRVVPCGEGHNRRGRRYRNSGDGATIYDGPMQYLHAVEADEVDLRELE